MGYVIYARVNPKNLVIDFIPSYYEKKLYGTYVKVEESDDVHALERYKSYDDLGVANYKYENGEIIERTEEEKEPERKAREEAKANQYIPSMTASMDAFLQYLIKKEMANFDVDTKLKTAGAYEAWTLGSYDVGDIRNHAGQTWECWTAHDNAIYPDITPDNPQTWANFWRPLHGKSPETARPWVKPQYGTTDMYHAGEYMVYTDEKVYKCLSDTVYSPDEYAQAWRVVGEASEPDGGEGGESGGDEDVQEPSTEEYPEWSQPLGAHDAYAQGAKVSHNGKKWTSDVANNVWEPGVYGWTEVPEE